MNIRRILPIEMNLVFRNIKDYLFQENIHLLKDSNKPRCYFLDAASYGNLGDQAIALSMTYFIRNIFGDERVAIVNDVDILRQFRSIKSEIRENDIIVLSGGGNMGDKYPRYEAIRRKIVKSFPRNKIVIFPQTIDYSNDIYGQSQLNNAVKTYNRHKNLYITARENKSYDSMKEIFKNVYCAPDIVFYLSKYIHIDSGKNKKGIGICLRDDQESLLNKEVKNNLYNTIKEHNSVGFISTMGKNLILTEEERLHAIKNKIEEFAKYRLVITDRLHGMIFSLLSNTACCVIDNKNMKVYGVCDYCKLEEYGVIKCKTPEEIIEHISYYNDKKYNELQGINYDILTSLLVDTYS